MDTDTHASYAHNGKVMLAAAILLFLILLIVIFFHTYAHSCFRRRQRHNPQLFPHLSATTASPHKALDPSLFKFLPTFAYSSAIHRPLQDCAVCLAEFEEDDEARLLPNCNHGFHSHCIDTWFRSHSNCPICRSPVQPPIISPQKVPVCVPQGELVGCSYLPPAIGSPRRGLEVVEMVGVLVEMSGQEEERLRKSESGVPVESGLKSSDQQSVRMKGIWR